jgi:hypothetical protein
MRLTHEAFRGAMPRLVQAAETVAKGEWVEQCSRLL